MTEQLRTMILDALRHPAFPTSDALLRMLVGARGYGDGGGDEHHRAPRTRSPLTAAVDQKRAMRFATLLAALVDEKRVERWFDQELGEHRYRLTQRYRLRQVIDSWHVDRLHPDNADHWHTIVMATESEARACLRALEVMP